MENARIVWFEKRELGGCGDVRRKGDRRWARWRRKGENWVWREFEKSVELIGAVAGEFEVGVDEWRGMFVQGKMLGVDKVRS